MEKKKVELLKRVTEEYQDKLDEINKAMHQCISSFSKFDILKHSGLFLVQLAILDVLASARTVGKY